MKATLRAAVERNEDMISAAVCLRDGNTVVEIGPHLANWKAASGDVGSYDQISVPIVTGDQQRWGSVQVRFQPIEKPGLFGIFGRSSVRIFVFTPALSLLLFFMFLKKMLQHLDPSKVVPSRVRSALDALAGGLLVLDDRARIVMANLSFANAVGRLPKELQGARVDDLPWLDPESQEPASGRDWLSFAAGGESQPNFMTSLAENRSNKPRTFWVSTAPILGEKGNSRGALVSMEDVTLLREKELELKKMLEALAKSREEISRQNEELRALATQDSLTGCLNRRSFFERFDKHWKTTERYQHDLSVVMFDLDHFKAVNDNHGHSMGDAVLQKAAAALEATARDVDVVCRYGGEEFCVLLPHTDIEGAALAGERFRRSIEAIELSDLSITASIGVSSFSLGATDPQSLLDQADKCLYVAKRNGRNQVVRWDEVPDDLEVDEAKISRTVPAESLQENPLPFHAVSALISALGYRDAGTASHSRRVADLCVTLANRIMSASSSYVLEVAALLHDIGKIGVPDSILLKPGPLTPEEWKVMHVHDRIGVEIVSSAFSCPELTEIIANHHAFYGGKGHGDNAPTGADIPLGARILSIADTYDAIVSDRVYRKGASQETAFAELRRCGGTQFDPELVEAFIEAMLARDDNRYRAVAPVTKETALSIGAEIERVAGALDNRDISGLATLAGRLKQTAAKGDFPQLSELAAELEAAADDGAEMTTLVLLTHDLLDLCRSTQRAFLADCHEVRSKVTTTEVALASD
jgi:diguanylate cyclase (GGDEF)-like protein/putative nucleotidyltransferase with HDIG domain